MQQFVIPQFIDVEDKIIGPITTRQFITMLVVAFIAFVTYRLVYFTTFVACFLVEAGIGAVLAFVRVNGRPFHFFLLNLVQTLGRPSLRVWGKRPTAEELQRDTTAVTAATPALAVVKRTALASSRLSELSLVVDTGGVYRGEQRAG
jgi:hypothetical protein